MRLGCKLKLDLYQPSGSNPVRAFKLLDRGESLEKHKTEKEVCMVKTGKISYAIYLCTKVLLSELQEDLKQ